MLCIKCLLLWGHIKIKLLLAVNNNPSFVSLYRNGNIFIDIEKRYCDAAQENRYYIGTQYLQDVQCFRWVNALWGACQNKVNRKLVNMHLIC